VGRTDTDEMARALYAEHRAALLSYVAYLVGGDRQLAEDLVQETLLRAWRHAADLDVATARPWLYTTARRLVIDHVRARRARPAEASADGLEGAVTGDGIDRALDAIVVADALTGLSAAHRTVLVECYYRGHTITEVAKRLDVPAGTVRSRLHYALRAMRLALQERGLEA
jgi:RNA polymerase sigma-70 factor (ECF subfamily)